MERLQDNVDEVVSKIEKTELRGKQKAMYMCSARCCDVAKTVQELQECSEKCSFDFVQSQQIVMSHMEHFQNRLSRCANVCQDKASALMPREPSNKKDVEKAEAKFESCISECAREMTDYLPKLESDIRSDLQRSGKR